MKAAGTLNIIAGSLIVLIGGFVLMMGVSLSVAVVPTAASGKLLVIAPLVIFIFAGAYLIRGGLHRLRAGNTSLSEAPGSSLKRRNMVTPEEYATKRQDILKDL